MLHRKNGYVTNSVGKCGFNCSAKPISLQEIKKKLKTFI